MRAISLAILCFQHWAYWSTNILHDIYHLVLKWQIINQWTSLQKWEKHETVGWNPDSHVCQGHCSNTFDPNSKKCLQTNSYVNCRIKSNVTIYIRTDLKQNPHRNSTRVSWITSIATLQRRTCKEKNIFRASELLPRFDIVVALTVYPVK